MVTRRPLTALAIAALLSTIVACGFTGEPDPGWVNGNESPDAGAQPPPALDSSVEPAPDMSGGEPADLGSADAAFDGEPGPDIGPACAPDAGPDADTDGHAPDGGLDPCAPDDTADGGADAEPEPDTDLSFDPTEG